MFTVSGMAAKDAQGYYEKDSYYTQEGKGQWSGELAKDQGREGEIDSEDWKKAVWGKDRDGNELVIYEKREYTKPDGTVRVQDKEGGTDITYSLPKGFSLVVEAYKDSKDPRLRDLADKIMTAHHNAVAKTNEYIETNLVAARVWKNGRAEHEFTGKAAFGNYDHHISREQDPQTHTHSFLLNMARTADGKWRAIDNRPIYENQKYLGQMHMSEFAMQLKEQGVPLLDRSHGNVELAGMPKEIIEHASARSGQIKEQLPELRHQYPYASEARLKEIACLATRKKKELVTNVKEWRSDLRAEFRQLGYNDKDIADRIDHAREAAKEKYANQPSTSDAVIKAADVLSYGESVFSRQELVIQTAQLYPTAYRIQDLERAADMLLKDGRNLRDLSKNGKHLTTPSMEHIEAENITMTRKGVDQVRPLMDKNQAKEKAETIRINEDRSLTASQREAFATVMSTGDRIVIMQGYAGTGKTTLFRELNREFAEKGFELRGMSFTGKAAGELKNASGIESSTIHSFLQREESMKEDTVYVVDEASMVGSRQLNQLLHMAEHAGSRVILSGDRWQIPSTASGKPFSDIQDDHRIASAFLKDIVRQREGSAEHRISQAFVERNVEKIIDALEKAGAIRYEQNDLKRAENAFDEVMKNWKNTISMAATNAQVREGGDRFHASLRERGEIGQKEVQVMIKEPVSFKSDAERHFAHIYEDGDYLQINQKWPGGPRQGTTLQVVGREEARGLLYVKGTFGKQFAIVIRDHGGEVTAYRERQIALSQGEKIMFLKNSLHGTGKLGVRNGDIAFVRRVSDDGMHMVVDKVIDLKEGLTEEVAVPLDKYNYFRYGYVGTVDKSQGATAPRAVGRDLQDFQRTYVAGTRENQELSLHFRDPEALREALNTYLTKSSSWAIKRDEAGHAVEQAQKGVQGQERSDDRESNQSVKVQEQDLRQQQKAIELDL
jgi:conjugative relaxase-like TrwC/TraI family protein